MKKRGKFLLLTAIILLTLVTTISAKIVILDESNNYKDIIEKDVEITKEEKTPILGKNLEFSCGTCNTATFENPVTQIGQGKEICGLKGGIPLQIVQDDLKICARSTLTKNTYDIDLLTWVAHGKCNDNDDGETCSKYENKFTYERSEKFVLKTLDIKVGSKKDQDLENKEDGYIISEDAKPDDEITISIDLENDFEDLDIEAFLEVIIKDLDDGDDIEENTKKETIRAGSDESLEVKLKIPERLDEDSYDLEILIEGEDDDNTIHKIEKKFIIEIDRDSHDLRITKLTLKPEIISCSESSNLDIKITNYGEKEEEEVKITISNTDLGIEIEKFDNGDIEIDHGTDDDAEYLTSIPIKPKESSPNGDYQLDVKVYRDKSRLEDQNSVILKIEECEGSGAVSLTNKNDQENKELSLNESSFLKDNWKIILIITAIIFIIILIILFI